MDLGISAQSMLLQAAEIGLNGICIGAFDKERIKQEFHLAYEPLLILAVGKGIEKIELVPIAPATATPITVKTARITSQNSAPKS